jgi:fermentation-respiration switch protein FrsA (DUF1100 family)
MIEERVSFYSERELVSGILRLPDDVHQRPVPAVVQGPGWLQVKEAKRNTPYHEAWAAAGIATLIIESEGDPTDLLPDRWIADLQNAVSYLCTREDIDPRRIGTFGSGSTGGSNAIVLSARDPRVRFAIAQVPIADGTDWLRGMRREYEWFEFLARLEADRRTRVLTGQGEMVSPRGDIMVTTPLRAAREAAQPKQDIYSQLVSLRSAEAIMAYRPIDHVAAARAVFIIGVEDDPVTPTEHCYRLYEQAVAPKKLIIQRYTTHYAAYEDYADEVIPQMVEWAEQHLAVENLELREVQEPG